VKWAEDRSEELQGHYPRARSHQYVELCGTRDGKITGLRTKVYAGLGGYASTAAPGIRRFCTAWCIRARTPFPTFTEHPGSVHGGNTGGRLPRRRPPRSRLFNRETGGPVRPRDRMDPVEIRRKNFIPADKFPYTTVTGLTYDSGNYPAAMDKALGMLDYQGFRKQQAEARKTKPLSRGGAWSPISRSVVWGLPRCGGGRLRRWPI